MCICSRGKLGYLLDEVHSGVGHGRRGGGEVGQLGVEKYGVTVRTGASWGSRASIRDHGCGGTSDRAIGSQSCE